MPPVSNVFHSCPQSQDYQSSLRATSRTMGIGCANPMVPGHVRHRGGEESCECQLWGLILSYRSSKDTRSGCLIRRTVKNAPKTTSDAKQKPGHHCGTPGLSMKK